MKRPQQEWPHADPGRRRHKITLQRLSGAVDSVGQQTTWSDLGTAWASVDPLSGRELLAGQVISAPGSFLITVNYNAGWGLAPKDRILWGTRIFDISNVRNPDEINMLLEIEAVERL